MKYLARYLTGGPISDARLVSCKNGHVTFNARKGTTHGGSDEVEEVSLPATEFVSRWSLHILPHGFTKTRGYGGWSNHHRKRYVSECREFLAPEMAETAAPNCDESSPDNDLISEDASPVGRPCPTCGAELELIEQVNRTSWRDIIGGLGCPAWNTFRERPG